MGVAEASEMENNSEELDPIVMNNEEEADLSLLCYLFCWNDCLVHSGKISLSLALTYPYTTICLLPYLFTFCYYYKLLFLSLLPIFPDVTLSLLLFGLYIMHSKSFVALVIGTNWNKNLVEFVPYL